MQALNNAISAKGGAAPNGEEVKRGFEAIHDFTLGGIVPPLKITEADHEGGGYVQVWQVEGGKLVKKTDWYRAYPEVVQKQIKMAEK